MPVSETLSADDIRHDHRIMITKTVCLYSRIAVCHFSLVLPEYLDIFYPIALAHIFVFNRACKQFFCNHYSGLAHFSFISLLLYSVPPFSSYTSCWLLHSRNVHTCETSVCCFYLASQRTYGRSLMNESTNKWLKYSCSVRITCITSQLSPLPWELLLVVIF